MSDLVRVKFKEEAEREDFLLYDGGRFNIKSGEKEEIKLERDIPNYSARFQINRSLYVCGGKRKLN